MRLALVLAVVVSLNAAPARACDPGPIFVVRVESADAPECLERSPVKSSPAAFGSAADSTQTARLRIRNRCKESANLSARTCAACGPGLTLAPGASGELVLETRGQGDAVDYDKHTKQVLTWTIGAGSGSIATDVTVTDDPAACGASGRRSCCAAAILVTCPPHAVTMTQ
ncbi:MAG: hypothetical protein IPI67_23515 [Myxococcales bacterium]|nr:hypothetical protein [Myxococcales bacterium]